ncbi:MAG: DUF4256 domain-containing protein, partial [Acidobacteriota bacterium]
IAAVVFGMIACVCSLAQSDERKQLEFFAGNSWALFCDRRYNTVFLYHNGAESSYAARGFRGSLRVLMQGSEIIPFQISKGGPLPSRLFGSI